MEEPIRGKESRGSETTEGTGRRKQTAAVAARGGAAGQGDFEGSVGGQLLIPARRRQAVERARCLASYGDRIIINPRT